MSDDDFQDLIRRVRAGDPAAATELVRRYERAIRLAVRVRLTDPELRRVFDSMDICQSVLASFFVRAAAGKYELDGPAQLMRLLEVMARNKLLKHVERQRTRRRGRGHLRRNLLEDQDHVDPGPGPADLAAYQELLEEFRRRLSAEERHLADQRVQGRSWTDIAGETGERTDTVRMRLTRAIERVSQELRLED